MCGWLAQACLINMHKWFVFPKFDEASEAAADFLAENIKHAIQKNDVCHVVLPGGNTPASCLGILAEKKLPWDKVHWYLGDERCYPQGHEERNDVMLEKYLWSHISNTNIHRIPAEKGAEAAAEDYRKLIVSIGSFDIAFLGMGEDGHTASLFPGNSALTDLRSVVPVYDAPKPPNKRVSLSITTLQKSQCRLVLTGGENKSDAISRVKNGEATNQLFRRYQLVC